MKPRRLWEERWSKITESSEGQRGYTHVGENVGDEKSLGDNKTTWREKSAVGETKVQLARKKFSW